MSKSARTLRTRYYEPRSAYIAAVGALWAALAFCAVVIWIALRVRLAVPISPREIVLGLAFDALLAIIVGYVLYLGARRWAAADLPPRRVLARLAALSLGFFLLAYAIVLVLALWRGAAIEEALPRLFRAWPAVAVDFSFFWAIAISVVPIPFLRRHGSAPPDVLEVRSTGQIEYVPVDAVLAVTAAENYVELHLASRTVLHRATLDQMARQLTGAELPACAPLRHCPALRGGRMSSRGARTAGARTVERSADRCRARLSPYLSSHRLDQRSLFACRQMSVALHLGPDRKIGSSLPMASRVAVLIVSSLIALPMLAQEPAPVPPPGIAQFAGRAPEMDRLLPLVGTWKFTPEHYRPKKGEWVADPPFFAAFTARYDGQYVESEQILDLGPGQAFHNLLIFSYDKFRKVYRMIAMENIVGLIDVFEGQFSGDTLVVDDERSGTAAPNLAGKLESARFSIRFVSTNEITILVQARRGGEWVDGARFRLERQRIFR